MVSCKSIAWKYRLTFLMLAIAGPVSVGQASAHEANDSEPAYSLSDNSPADDSPADDSPAAESCSEPVDIDWQECSNECCPLWSVKAGTVIMTRELPRATPLLAWMCAILASMALVLCNR